MSKAVLNEEDLKNILFDVLDGIPAQGDEPQEAFTFRQEIEKSDGIMAIRAEELGLKNVLLEFPTDTLGYLSD